MITSFPKRTGTSLGERLDIVFSELKADHKRYAAKGALMHALRKLQILNLGDEYRLLIECPAYRHHVSTLWSTDKLFFLSHRHYMVDGLTVKQRIDGAITHYCTESGSFDEDYVRQVYLHGGLRLWGRTVNGVDYAIRLCASDDAAFEGPLNLLFEIDGARTCVLAYGILPSSSILPAPEAAKRHTVILVTRKQLTRNHDYQAQFNKAFDRTTPAHLCFGALAGIAMAQGYSFSVGIDPRRSPSYAQIPTPQFIAAYEDFWASLHGERVSPFGYRIDIPLAMTPLEDLDARKRKRAIARRAHIDEVRQNAESIVAAHLRR
jgi:uncharacterized protein VirK/YbjX